MRWVFALLFALILPTALAAAPLWSVLKIADGDTITAGRGKQQIKVRFWGIDAPESKQPFGQFCKRALAQKISGKRLRIDVKDTDRYGRKVARLFLGSEDINGYMVKIGCAWAYRQYSSFYVGAEAAARRARVGLWQSANPQAPWKWRREHPQPWQKNAKKHKKSAKHAR